MSQRCIHFSVVMPRLGLGIHEFGATGKQLVDPKAKPWDDDRVGCGK
jgi:hypothetical protein